MVKLKMMKQKPLWQKKLLEGATKSKQSETGKMIRMSGHTATLTSKGSTPREVKQEKRQCGKKDNFICGACGQLGHVRTNKMCPKYGEDQENTEMDTNSIESNPLDQTSQTLNKKLITTVSFEDTETKGPDCIEKTKSVPVKFKCGALQRSLGWNMPPSGSLDSVEGTVDVTDFRSTGKADKILKSNKMKFDDYPPDILKASVVFRPPAEFGKNIPSKITVKQPKVLLDQQRHVQFRTVQEPTRKIVELSGPENKIREDWSDRQAVKMNSLFTFNGEREMQEHMLIEAGIHEKREEGIQSIKNKIKGKRKPEFQEAALLYRRPYKDERRVPERHRTSIRRRRGEVELSNILEKVVDCLRRNIAVSYIFLKPVTKKDAPDYLDIIDRPMDLGTIRDKVRDMEYKNRKGFRHDVAQIAVNAHIYNDNRNPGIPPLADELLKMCDQLLEENAEMLDDAEGAIE